MDMKLEVVVLPVADVDRAKGFHTGLGWRLDADVSPSEDFRVVQVTPPGSPASVIDHRNAPCASRSFRSGGNIHGRRERRRWHEPRPPGTP